MNRSNQKNYGFQFWLLPYDGYACCGMGDQLLLRYPHQDIAVVITADPQGIAGASDIIYRAVHEELLPVCRITPSGEKTDKRWNSTKRHLPFPFFRQKSCPHQRKALPSSGQSCRFSGNGDYLSGRQQRPVRICSEWKGIHPFKMHFHHDQLTVQMMKTEETKFLEYQGFLNS